MVNKSDMQLDLNKLTALHSKLAEKFMDLLDSELGENPKFLEALIKFLDNNGINISPVTGMQSDRSELQDILSQMTSKMQDEEPRKLKVV